MAESPLIQIIKPRLTRHVVCPYCGKKQLFAKQKEHWCKCLIKCRDERRDKN